MQRRKFTITSEFNFGPLLFLIFINYFPATVDSATSSKFADDSIIQTLLRVALTFLIWRTINDELVRINDWLISNKLYLNVPKTEGMLIGSRERLSFINKSPAIKIGNHLLKRVTRTKTVGVTAEEFFAWYEYIEILPKKLSSGVRALKTTRPFCN